MSQTDKVTLLICGGGNGAHAYAGIAASQLNTEARVLTLFADEAQRWMALMEGHDFKVQRKQQGREVGQLSGKPTLVTKDPAKAMAGVNIIALAVPAFAHAQYFEALKPHIQPGTIIVGIPGQAGFEFSVYGILGEKAKMCTIMNFESLPWACRIKEFGREVEVIGTKDGLVGAVQVGSHATSRDPIEMLQQTVGDHPVLKTHGHLLGMTLMGTNAYIHPSILYGRWHNWDGQAVDQPPLFYNGIDDYSANLLSAVSDEVVAIARAIMKQRPGVDLSNVVHIKDWYLRCYPDDIIDNSTLKSCVMTNHAYTGLLHPTTKTDDGKYVPNYKYRYITEDIPYGILVMMGVGEVAGVDTPNMKKIIEWSEKISGMNYLVDGKIRGPDVMKSRCPQKFNLVTLDAILG